MLAHSLIVISLFLGNPPGSDVQVTYKSLPELIAKYEGFYASWTLPHKLHNPGALSFANQRNATRGTGGYARFKTDEEGWAALRRDLKLKQERGATTLRKILRFWNLNYLLPLAKELGVKPDDVLQEP